MGIAYADPIIANADVSRSVVSDFVGWGGFSGRSLEDIIQTHGRQVRAIIRGILRSHAADWSDVEQTVWIRIMERIDSFRGQAECGTWIYRITTNICYDYLRRLASSRLADNSENLDIYAIENASVDARIAHKDLVGRLMRVLSKSDARLFRDYADGASVAELAVIYGLTPNTVKTRIFRIRRKLIARYERLEASGHVRRRRYENA